MSPRVTVLMSVHNGEKYLRESIESILHQTFTDFELLIINDASLDSSRDILHSYNDPRIRLIENRKNLGQAESLNIGINKAKGKYIARMDQDDISLPKRLKYQYGLMEDNDNIGVCGTFAQFINSDSKKIKFHYYEKLMTSNLDIKSQLLFRSCFIHPSVIIRLSFLKENHLYYEKSVGHAQDYLLWYRMSSLCDFMNIPKKLLKYRIHQEQLSKGKRNDQFSSSNNIRRIIIGKFLEREVSEAEKIKHTRISIAQYGSSFSKIDEAENWLKFLMNHNEINGKYNRKSLTKVLRNIWMVICMNSSHLGMKLLVKYFSSIYWKFKVENIYQEMKFILKCFIKYKVELLAYDWTLKTQDFGLSE